MRRDIAPADAPFSVDDLVRNFERIALYDEYVDVGGRFVRARDAGAAAALGPAGAGGGDDRRPRPRPRTRPATAPTSPPSPGGWRG